MYRALPVSQLDLFSSEHLWEEGVLCEALPSMTVKAHYTVKETVMPY
jgi:hypothetical protein